MNATKMAIFNGNEEEFSNWANSHVDVVNLTKHYSGTHWVLDYAVPETVKQLAINKGDMIAYNGKELVNLSR